MELNRAQLFVHDDVALNKFRTYHNIPKDIQRECSRSNEDANLVEGSRAHIPVRTWLIHQAGPFFPQPNAKRGDGTLPPHLFSSLRQLRLNHARGGHPDAPSRAPFQSRRLATCVHYGAVEEGAKYTLLQG